MRTASGPSVARYSGAMRSDGSWLPIIFTLCEDLADLVAIVVRSFDLFNFPDGLPVLLGQLRQGAAVLAGVDAAASTLASCLSCSSRVPRAVMLFMVAMAGHPFQNFPVCKSALDGTGVAEGGGGGPSPPLTSRRLKPSESARICPFSGRFARFCCPFARCRTSVRVGGCSNLRQLPARTGNRTPASGKRA